MLLAFLAVSPLVLVAVVAGVVIGLLVWGARNPLVWRLLSVLGMGAGAGFLVWGILLASLREEAPFATPAAIIAMGAGVLIGSIALLVVSYCGSCRSRKE
jgi:hypothetical protein